MNLSCRLAALNFRNFSGGYSVMVAVGSAGDDSVSPNPLLADPWNQDLGHPDGTVRLLMVLHHRNDGTANRDSGTIQGVR